MTIPTYQSYGADFADIYDAIFPREAVTADELVWLADRIGTGRIACASWGSRPLPP